MAGNLRQDAHGAHAVRENTCSRSCCLHAWHAQVEPLSLLQSDLIDLGYTGKIWIFVHEPLDVLWPMSCHCDEGKRWTEDPDYINKTSSVSVCDIVICLMMFASV